MSMTPDQISALSYFGQIPAETDISAIVERFWDDCVGRFDKPIANQAIAAKSGSINLTISKTDHKIEADTNLSAFVQDSHSRIKVFLFIQIYQNESGQTINLKYRDGDNTSDTTTNYGAYSYGKSCPQVFSWTVTPTNWAKNTICYPFAGSTTQARYTLLGFPYRV